ncbi:hypothetical protein [Pseudoalteromonas arctica]|uniref:Transposase n=1 Tax=Pseudoalteromonas arctica A 37-1-2 TaxID=1117313 RepID=A0A290S5J8_9GAMM|nr:hypothetical protein [Pseudoalteromonas arctica]ATC86291.1 hypothetical protein PARC_a1708 [Pseudoalteromonas arctica A 37-1-2]
MKEQKLVRYQLPKHQYKKVAQEHIAIPAHLSGIYLSALVI